MKSIDSKDRYGHTALDLACSRGFRNPGIQIFSDEDSSNLTFRAKAIELLMTSHKEYRTKEFALNMSSYQGGKYTPLHWSIYWGDAYMAYLVFKKNP